MKAIIPELSHFNVFKLLQDKADKDLTGKEIISERIFTIQ